MNILTGNNMIDGDNGRHPFSPKYKGFLLYADDIEDIEYEEFEDDEEEKEDEE